MLNRQLQPTTQIGPYQRAILLVVASTIVLTAMFVGALAFLEGATAGFSARVPWYFVATGVVFVSSILLLETQTDDGRKIIITTGLVTITGFVLIVFSIEGLIFAVRFPNQVLVSRVLLYFIAAGLLATGFGYWTLNHWREFTKS